MGSLTRLLAPALTVLLLAAPASLPAGAQDSDRDGDGSASASASGLAALAEGEGRESVYAHCSGCHSIRLVTQQRMSRARWDSLLDWMVDKQGMPAPDAQTREAILAYLAEHYGPRARRGRTPRR